MRVVVHTRYRTLIKVVKVFVPPASGAPAPSRHAAEVPMANPAVPPTAVAERPSDVSSPPASPLLWAGKLPSARFGPPIHIMPQS